MLTDINSVLSMIAGTVVVLGIVGAFYKKVIGTYNASKTTLSQLELLVKYIGPNGGKSLMDRLERLEERQIIQDLRMAMTLTRERIAEWRTDRLGRTIQSNGIEAVICGRHESEFMGYNWLAVVKEDERDEVRDEWSQAIQDRRTFEKEYTLVHSSGRSLPVKVMAWPMFDSTGEMIGYLGRTIFSEV